MYKKECNEQSQKETGQNNKNLCAVFGMCVFVCILLLTPDFSGIVSAADKINFNIDFSCGWNGFYRPMEWTPVEIMIGSDLEEAFGGELILSSQQDGLNTLNIKHDLSLTPDLPEYTPLVTKISYSAHGCSLRLDQKLGNRRKTVWSNEYDVWRSAIPGKNAVVNEQDMLIGIVGMGKFGLLKVDKQSVCKFQGANGNVCIGTKQPKQVPWDWTGFVSLDLLILYDPDWSQLREQQLKAITEWVSNGGKMLLVLGSNPPRGENPLTDVIPFDYEQARQVSLSQSLLYKWYLRGNESETVMLKPLVQKTNARIYTGDIYQDNQYFFGAGYVGFGRVGVLAFDPSDFSDFQNTNSAHFWTYFIQALLKSEELTNNPRSTQRTIEFVQNSDTSPSGSNRTVQYSNPYNVYQIGSAYSLNNVVMSFLYSEIKPLSVWFVILLLGALAVLLGPVDYKFLKSIDRLPLTWLTCSFWIILFTVGAYYGVQYIRGGKMQLKAVSVLDGIDDGSVAWATQYSGLFASRSDSYQIEGLKPDQWWSGIAPTQDQIYAYNSELGSRKIYCDQKNGGNLPESLPVNIWDIQCMLTESPIEKLPFSADVQQSGSNITVTVTNNSEAAISRGFILLKNNYGIEFSRVSAHGVAPFTKQSRRLTDWENIIRQFSQPYRGSSISNFRNEAALFAQGSLQRTRAINDYLNNGAALVCVTYDKAPLSFSMKDHLFSCEHVQLARLVVFPNEKGTGND